MKLFIILFGLQIFHLQNAVADDENAEDETEADFQVKGIQQVSFIDDYGFDFINLGREINGETLAQVRNLLKRIYNVAEQVQQRSDEIRQKWNTEIENTENNAHDTWQSWINNELQTYNGSRNASDILVSYVTATTHRIHACADLIRANIQDYELKVYELRNRFSKVASFLASQVPECIVNSNIECQRKVVIELRKLQNGPRDFSNLFGEGTALLLSDFQYNACVAYIQVEFENGKSKIQEQLNQL